VKAPSPAFSFYPKDIESDEACKAMNHAEFGMYIRLLMNCWTEGSIPADPERLQRLLRVSSRTFSAAWPAIAPCFTPGEDGRLVQSRLETEREKQVQRREENKRKGRSGGRPAKSNVSAESEKPLVMNGFPDRKPNESLPSPSPSSSPITNGYWASSGRAGEVTKAEPISEEQAREVDEIRAEHAAEESRLTANLLAIRDAGEDVQAALDSIAEKGRKPYSAYGWLRNGRSGVPETRAGVTVLRLLNAALEARQRAQAAPIISDSMKQTMEALQRSGDRIRARLAAEGRKEITA